jgi:oligoribonuclease NrnB/cAMP/cGMP phosphodiesterase (DHH superfamily)
MNNELKNEPNKTIHIIYHTDPDGYMSCSIIQKYLDDNAKLFEEYRKNYIPMNYDYKTDWINDITSDDIVYMSDFSLPFDKMKQINDKLNGKRFHWIDHHESSINKILNQENIENKLNNMSYLARVGEAGCELTWKYLFGEDSQIPPAVTLIGRYDVWDQETELHDWENEILPFIAYCNSKDFDPFNGESARILPSSIGGR